MKRALSINYNSTLIGVVVGAIVIAITPLVIHNNYSLGVLTFVAINTIIAVGLNLLMGYAGQISLGHAAFFAMGAYSSAILTTQYHVSPWLAMLFGIAVAGSIALLIGLPCLRLKGHYLAMATLGFGWIVYIVLVSWDTLTQGTSGICEIPPLAIGSLVFDNDRARLYLDWAITLIILAISANIVNSRVGRALRSLHGSELAAATLGVDIARFKVQVFVLSAVYAAIAGSLYAHTVNFISPSVFGFTFSVSLVVMVVIGGMASVWGAPLGAAAITLLVAWLQDLGEMTIVINQEVHRPLKEADVIAHGLILMLVMIFMPDGLTCGIRDTVGRFFRKRSKRPSDKPTTPVKEAALK